MTSMLAFWHRHHEAIIVGVGLLLLASILRSDSNRQIGFDQTLLEIRKAAYDAEKTRKQIVSNQELILKNLEACLAR